MSALKGIPSESMTDLLVSDYEVFAKAATESIAPMYKPEEPHLYEDTVKRLMWLSRQLFPKQAEMVAVAEEHLKTNKSLIVSSQTGTGKTSMGTALLTNPKVKVGFIESPSHLVKKWIREIDEIMGEFGFDIVEVKSYKDILPLTTKGEPLTRKTIFVGSKDSMKSTYTEVPVWKKRYWFVPEEKKKNKVIPRYKILQYCCTDCGKAIKTVSTAEIGMWMRKNKQSKKQAFAKFAPRIGITHCKECGQKQTQPTNNRMGAAEFLRRFGRKGVIDIAETDELHESKAKDTQRAMVSAVLIKLSKRYVGLTGTLLGGYASHAFYMLFRMFPHFMKEQMGYSWNSPSRFIEEFGGIERHYELESYDEVTGEFSSSGRCFGTKERAELSPRLQDVLLPFVAFMRLDEIRIPGEKALPPVTETKHILQYNEELLGAYDKFCADVFMPIREYGDETNNNEISLEQSRVLRAALKADSLLIPDMPFMSRTVDYYAFDKTARKEVLHTVKYTPPVTRKQLPLTNKEVKLLELINKARERGRRVLVFADFVTSGIHEELKMLIEANSTAKVEILTSKVPAAQREAYIKSLDCDVLITNPELVKTGLDLIEYPSVIFYQQVYTSFNVFTLRQAMMRSWRIGQTEPVEIHTLAYAATQQHTVYKLIASKINISAGVEGRLSTGDDMASEADESVALLIAKAILENKTSENVAESSSETFELKQRDWNTFEKFFIEHQERFNADNTDYLTHKPTIQDAIIQPIEQMLQSKSEPKVARRAKTTASIETEIKVPCVKRVKVKTVKGSVLVAGGGNKKSSVSVHVTEAALNEMVAKKGRVQLALF